MLNTTNSNKYFCQTKNEKSNIDLYTLITLSFCLINKNCQSSNRIESSLASLVIINQWLSRFYNFFD